MQRQIKLAERVARARPASFLISQHHYMHTGLHCYAMEAKGRPITFSDQCGPAPRGASPSLLLPLISYHGPPTLLLLHRRRRHHRRQHHLLLLRARREADPRSSLRGCSSFCRALPSYSWLHLYPAWTYGDTVPKWPGASTGGAVPTLALFDEDANKQTCCVSAC